MALATISVVAGSVVQSNEQRLQKFFGVLSFSAPTDTYPANGFIFDSAMLTALAAAGFLPESNRGMLYATFTSTAGYVYTRIPSTGRLQVLQVPPTGSLTTAAPLQQYPSSAISGIWADTVGFEVGYLRNA